MKLLVLNAGSSSLRFELFQVKGWKVLFKGHIDGIGTKAIGSKGAKAKNHTEALSLALKTLQSKGALAHPRELLAIGHRVVHGGEKYQKPTLITPKILRDLEKLSALAPLHNPPNLEGIRACQKLLPQIPNVAVFDTAFHATLPEHAYLYGLPYELYKKHGIRKYGFHGTSHAYVSEQTIVWLKKHNLPWGKIITCHIGNGVSVTAIKNGKSIETSMGFTPLEGAVMGTRAGSFDPAILLHLMRQIKKSTISPAALDHLINHESGLLGLSGVSSDVRPLWAIAQNRKHRDHKKVLRAFKIFSYRLAMIIAGYTAALGGLDALVFTAGIGENAWYLRRDICAQLAHLGIKLNSLQNRTTVEGKQGPIHASKNSIPILVVPTHEELKIAMETEKICKK